MKKNEKNRTMVPVSALAPYIEEYLVGIDSHRIPNSGERIEMGPMDILAFQAGVDRESIRRLINGSYHHITFIQADKIICGMGKPFLWYQDPELNEAYNNQSFKRSRIRNPNAKPQRNGDVYLAVLPGTLEEIAERVGVNYSTARSAMSRLGKRVKKAQGSPKRGLRNRPIVWEAA